MNDTTYNKYQSAARSKRRAVVGIVIYTAIILFLSVQWHATSTPYRNNGVGNGANLSDNVVAVITLYNEAKDDDFVNRTKAHLLISKEASSIALMQDGSFSEIPAGELANFIQNTSRPHGWFIPGTIGVAYIKEGERVTTRRLTSHVNSISISANSTTTMNAPFPTNAITGLHLECIHDCEPIKLAGEDLEIPTNIQNLDFVTVMDHGVTESLFIFNKDVSTANVELFARKLAALSTPTTMERKLDSGITVTELVPNDNVPKVNIDDSNIIMYGDKDGAIFFTTTETFSYISTSRNVLENATGRLSTIARTNTICGQTPAIFMPVNFSSTFAENPTSPLYIVRNKYSWSICENNQ